MRRRVVKRYLSSVRSRSSILRNGGSYFDRITNSCGSGLANLKVNLLETTAFDCDVGSSSTFGACRPPALLVSVRRVLESYESYVIQELWPDSRRVTDVDEPEPRPLRPQQVAISERSDR